MFWRNGIPENLKDCLNDDDVARELYRWSERIYTAAVPVAAFTVLLGIIMTLRAIGAVIEISDTEAGLAGIATGITWLVYTAAGFIACRLLAVLLAAAATVTQNTAISAKTALFQASQARTPSKEKPRKEKTDIDMCDGSAPPYYCERCGKHGPYNGKCPRCGSDQKCFD